MGNRIGEGVLPDWAVLIIGCSLLIVGLVLGLIFGSA